MSQVIRKRGKKGKEQEYVYDRVWDRETKRYKERCLGNVKNMPKVVDRVVDVPLTDMERMYPEFYKALECDNIDAVLVEFVRQFIEDYLKNAERFFGGNLGEVAYRSKVCNEILHNLKIQGVSPEFVKIFREFLVQWRKAPAYVAPEIEIKSAD
jgi:hypothetical protein